MLCGDRSPLVPIKPQRWNLPYSIEKQHCRTVRLPTGEEAFKIVCEKEKKRKQNLRKKIRLLKSKQNLQSLLSSKTKILNGGGRQRNCGEYRPLQQSKILNSL